ncbi:MAG TPA: Crp/Fnr family transcriptional regulator [Sphingomicrobium sp.]|nr:Crp/Fnr family transcriptional regulator [Sphingomicrobium sp.]
MDAGGYLVREGMPPLHCAILVNGFAFRHKLTGHGARQILAICIPGDAVDLQHMFLDVADHSVQLVTRATVVDVPRDILNELFLRRPAIARAVTRMALIEGSIIREWVLNIGRRDARQRIAHILCEFAVRLEALQLPADSCGFELPLTQEQLADATGLTSVHVNRVLKALEADGLIERNRRLIRCRSWRALQQAGDFSRAYLHVASEDEFEFAA